MVSYTDSQPGNTAEPLGARKGRGFWPLRPHSGAEGACGPSADTVAERKPHGAGDTGTTRADGCEHEWQDLWPGSYTPQCSRARTGTPGCRSPYTSWGHPYFLQSLGPRAPDSSIPGRTSPETY